MRVLMISSNYPPSIGGPAASVPYLSKKLIERGHEVEIVTRQLAELPVLEKDDKLVIHRPSLVVSGDFYRPRQALMHSVSMGLLARRVFERGSFDILHAHDVNISGIAGLIASRNRCSVVKYSGDLVQECSSFLKWNQRKDISSLLDSCSPDTLLLKYLENAIINSYELVIAPSRFQCKMLQALGINKERIRIIPNAIDSELIKKTSRNSNLIKKREKNRELILTIGRLVPWKGFEFLISAMKEVMRTRPSARLIIIGDGPDLDHLKELAKSQGLLDNGVTFLGRKAHDEIPTYISKADVFALPSIYEPAPHVLMEAMSCGKPIVATNVGGIPEILTNGVNGLLVEAGNSNSLSEAILTLLQEKRLSRQLGRNARARSQKFSWESTVSQYEKLYYELKDLC